MPSDREKNRAAINQEILARVRVLTLLFRLFLNKADYYILVGFATNRLFRREEKAPIGFFSPAVLFVLLWRLPLAVDPRVQDPLHLFAGGKSSQSCFA
jgi:hypothetical protein